MNDLSAHLQKLLLTQKDVETALSLSQEEVEWLIHTGQLTPILIRGCQRFVYSQLESLIKTYTTVQGRILNEEK